MGLLRLGTITPSPARSLAPAEHGVQHRLREPAGEGVLLARVVGAEQHGPAVDRRARRRGRSAAWAARRAAGRRRPRRTGPRHTITRTAGSSSSSSRRVGQAVVALLGQRLVGGRRAAHRRAPRTRRCSRSRRPAWTDVRLVREAGAVQRGEQPVARAVAGEHAAGAVAAVGGGRQAEHVHARRRGRRSRARAGPSTPRRANAARFSRATRSRHSTSRGQRRQRDPTPRPLSPSSACRRCEQPLGPQVGRDRERGGDREREPDRHVALAEEAEAHRVDEVEERVEVRQLLPRRGQQVTE